MALSSIGSTTTVIEPIVAEVSKHLVSASKRSVSPKRSSSYFLSLANLPNEVTGRFL